MRAKTISYILSSFLSTLPIKEIHFSARESSVSMAFLHVLWCSWCKWKCSGVKFFLYSRIKQRKNHIQGNRQLQSFCIDLAWIQSFHTVLVNIKISFTYLYVLFYIFTLKFSPLFNVLYREFFFFKSLDTSSCNVAKFFSPQLINLNKFHFFQFLPSKTRKKHWILWWKQIIQKNLLFY